MTPLKEAEKALKEADRHKDELWSKKGLVTFYLLFVMEVATRRVCFAGCTPIPDGDRMKQMARNLTDAEEGFLKGKRYLLMDRDTKFCAAFRQILEDAGTEPVLLPPRSPNLNAHLERFWRSLRSECLDRMIFFGELKVPSVGDSYGRRARRRRRELRIDWDFPSVEPPDYLLQLNPDLTLAVEVGIVLAALLYIRKVTRTTTVVRVTTDDVEHGRVHLLQDKPIPDYVAGSRSRIFTRLRA